MGDRLRAYGWAIGHAIACLFHQHETVLDTSSPGTMRLKCLHCSYRSPGVSTVEERR